MAEFQSSLEKRNSTAVTSLDFTEDDNYLQMCSMRVDKDHVKDFSAGDDIFVVWDIAKNELLIDTDVLSKAKWASWTLANAVNARF